MVSTVAAVDSENLESLVNVHAAAAQYLDDLEGWWLGRQGVKLTERMKQYLAAHSPDTDAAQFRDNYLDLVVSSLADRLRVTGFTVPGEAPVSVTDGGTTREEPGPFAQFAADTWAVSRGDALQLRVHDTAIALGDSFVIVEWDAARQIPALHFNAPGLVRMHYDPANVMQPLFATKLWDISMPSGGKSTRLNVYHPNRIERYIRSGTLLGGRWREFADDDLPAVIPCTMDGTLTGEPVGILVVHFSNNPVGMSAYGRSEMSEAIPLQRAINKVVIDALRVADAQGWPQRWATGVTVGAGDLDADPGSIWEVTESEAKIGQLEPASPEGAIALLTKFEDDLAVVTRTPISAFRATNISGESRKVAEAPLVKKAEKRQTQFGNSWEDVQVRAARLGIANGVLTGELPPTGYATTWAEAGSRPAELDHILSVNAKQGLSTQQRLREYGYTDEEIERILDEREAETDDLEAMMGEAMDAGRGGGGAFGGGSPGPRQQRREAAQQGT